MTARPVHPRRAATTANQRVLVGRPVVYGVTTRINTPFGPFDEQIAPGSLRSALAGSNGGAVALVRDHDSSLLLARRGSGTLDLQDLPTDLYMTAILPDTPLGSETWTLTDRGDLSGMSFAFTVSEDGTTWHEQDSGVPLRVVREVTRLWDVSVVTWPAYPQTSLSARTSTALTDRDRRTRLVSRHIGMTGGIMAGVGRSTRPAPGVLSWCDRRPWRVAGHAGVDRRSALDAAAGRA